MTCKLSATVTDNPTIFNTHSRPIVEFALEDQRSALLFVARFLHTCVVNRKLLVRKKRLEKAEAKKKLAAVKKQAEAKKEARERRTVAHRLHCVLSVQRSKGSASAARRSVTAATTVRKRKRAQR